MNSKTTTIAEHYRLQQWAAQIKDCQNRPEGMRITEWCIQNGITKGNYYYRLRRVREAYLNDLTKENGSQDIVPVDAQFLCQTRTAPDALFQGLDISLAGCSIHVAETTSMKLLSAVLEVIRNAE